MMPSTTVSKWQVDGEFLERLSQNQRRYVGLSEMEAEAQKLRMTEEFRDHFTCSPNFRFRMSSYLKRLVDFGVINRDGFNFWINPEQVEVRLSELAAQGIYP